MQVNLTEFSKDVPAYLKMVSTGKEVFIPERIPICT